LLAQILSATALPASDRRLSTSAAITSPTQTFASVPLLILRAYTLLVAAAQGIIVPAAGVEDGYVLRKEHACHEVDSTTVNDQLG